MAFAVRDDASVEFNELGAATYTLAQLAIEWTNVRLSYLGAILFSTTTSVVRVCRFNSHMACMGSLE